MKDNTTRLLSEQRGIALCFNLPRPYSPITALQEHLVAARIEGEIPDTVLLLQHHPVVTMGRRGRNQYLKLSPEEYQSRKIEVTTAARGGDVTYHAPGQWVLYPIMKLDSKASGAHGYLYNLEEVALRTAADFGVDAFRREGKSGAWAREGKFAAIGFRLKRWVSYHGMSFNVNLDLSGFDTIVPCGLVGEPVASLQTILKDQCPSMDEVKTGMLKHVQDVFERTLDFYNAESEWPEILAPFKPVPMIQTQGY